MNKGSKSISRGEKIVQGKIVAYHRLDSHLFPVSLSPISKPMGKKCEAQIYSFAIYSSRPQNRKSLSLLTPSNRYGSMGTACFYTTPPIISILGNEPRCSKGCFVVVFTKNPIFAFFRRFVDVEWLLMGHTELQSMMAMPIRDDH